VARSGSWNHRGDLGRTAVTLSLTCMPPPIAGIAALVTFFVSSVLKFPIAYHTFRPVLVTRWMLRLVRPDRIRPEGVIRLSMARFFDAVIGVGALVAQHLLIAGQHLMPIFVRVLLESVARLSTLPGIPAPNATTVVYCAPCTMCISRYRPRYT